MPASVTGSVSYDYTDFIPDEIVAELSFGALFGCSGNTVPSSGSMPSLKDKLVTNYVSLFQGDIDSSDDFLVVLNILINEIKSDTSLLANDEKKKLNRMLFAAMAFYCNKIVFNRDLLDNGATPIDFATVLNQIFSPASTEAEANLDSLLADSLVTARMEFAANFVRYSDEVITQFTLLNSLTDLIKSSEENNIFESLSPILYKKLFCDLAKETLIRSSLLGSLFLVAGVPLLFFFPPASIACFALSFITFAYGGGNKALSLSRERNMLEKEESLLSPKKQRSTIQVSDSTNPLRYDASFSDAPDVSTLESIEFNSSTDNIFAWIKQLVRWENLKQVKLGEYQLTRGADASLNDFLCQLVLLNAVVKNQSLDSQWQELKQLKQMSSLLSNEGAELITDGKLTLSSSQLKHLFTCSDYKTIVLRDIAEKADFQIIYQFIAESSQTIALDFSNSNVRTAASESTSAIIALLEQASSSFHLSKILVSKNASDADWGQLVSLLIEKNPSLKCLVFSSGEQYEIKPGESVKQFLLRVSLARVGKDSGKSSEVIKQFSLEEKVTVIEANLVSGKEFDVLPEDFDRAYVFSKKSNSSGELQQLFYIDRALHKVELLTEDQGELSKLTRYTTNSGNVDQRTNFSRFSQQRQDITAKIHRELNAEAIETGYFSDAELVLQVVHIKLKNESDIPFSQCETALAYCDKLNTIVFPVAQGVNHCVARREREQILVFLARVHRLLDISDKKVVNCDQFLSSVNDWFDLTQCLLKNSQLSELIIGNKKLTFDRGKETLVHFLLRASLQWSGFFSSVSDTVKFNAVKQSELFATVFVKEKDNFYLDENNFCYFFHQEFAQVRSVVFSAGFLKSHSFSYILRSSASVQLSEIKCTSSLKYEAWVNFFNFVEKQEKLDKITVQDFSFSKKEFQHGDNSKKKKQKIQAAPEEFNQFLHRAFLFDAISDETKLVFLLNKGLKFSNNANIVMRFPQVWDNYLKALKCFNKYISQLEYINTIMIGTTRFSRDEQNLADFLFDISVQQAGSDQEKLRAVYQLFQKNHNPVFVAKDSSSKPSTPRTEVKKPTGISPGSRKFSSSMLVASSISQYRDSSKSTQEVDMSLVSSHSEVDLLAVSLEEYNGLETIDMGGNEKVRKFASETHQHFLARASLQKKIQLNEEIIDDKCQEFVKLDQEFNKTVEKNKADRIEIIKDNAKLSASNSESSRRPKSKKNITYNGSNFLKLINKEKSDTKLVISSEYFDSQGLEILRACVVDKIEKNSSLKEIIIDGQRIIKSKDKNNHQQFSSSVSRKLDDIKQKKNKDSIGKEVADDSFDIVGYSSYSQVELKVLNTINAIKVSDKKVVVRLTNESNRHFLARAFIIKQALSLQKALKNEEQSLNQKKKEITDQIPAKEKEQNKVLAQELFKKFYPKSPVKNIADKQTCTASNFLQIISLISYKRQEQTVSLTINTDDFDAASIKMLDHLLMPHNSIELNVIMSDKQKSNLVLWAGFFKKQQNTVSLTVNNEFIERRSMSNEFFIWSALSKLLTSEHDETLKLRIAKSLEIDIDQDGDFLWWVTVDQLNDSSIRLDNFQARNEVELVRLEQESLKQFLLRCSLHGLSEDSAQRKAALSHFGITECVSLAYMTNDSLDLSKVPMDFRGYIFCHSNAASCKLFYVDNHYNEVLMLSQDSSLVSSLYTACRNLLLASSTQKELATVTLNNNQLVEFRKNLGKIFITRQVFPVYFAIKNGYFPDGQSLIDGAVDIVISASDLNNNDNFKQKLIGLKRLRSIVLTHQNLTSIKLTIGREADALNYLVNKVSALAEFFCAQSREVPELVIDRGCAQVDLNALSVLLVGNYEGVKAINISQDLLVKPQQFQLLALWLAEQSNVQCRCDQFIGSDKDQNWLELVAAFSEHESIGNLSISFKGFVLTKQPNEHLAAFLLKISLYRAKLGKELVYNQLLFNIVASLEKKNWSYFSNKSLLLDKNNSLLLLINNQQSPVKHLMLNKDCQQSVYFAFSCKKSFFDSLEIVECSSFDCDKAWSAWLGLLAKQKSLCKVILDGQTFIKGTESWQRFAKRLSLFRSSTCLNKLQELIKKGELNQLETVVLKKPSDKKECSDLIDSVAQSESLIHLVDFNKKTAMVSNIQSQHIFVINIFDNNLSKLDLLVKENESVIILNLRRCVFSPTFIGKIRSILRENPNISISGVEIPDIKADHLDSWLDFLVECKYMKSIVINGKEMKESDQSVSDSFFAASLPMLLDKNALNFYANFNLSGLQYIASEGALLIPENISMANLYSIAAYFIKQHKVLKKIAFFQGEKSSNFDNNQGENLTQFFSLIFCHRFKENIEQLCKISAKLYKDFSLPLQVTSSLINADDFRSRPEFLKSVHSLEFDFNDFEKSNFDKDKFNHFIQYSENVKIILINFLGKKILVETNIVPQYKQFFADIFSLFSQLELNQIEFFMPLLAETNQAKLVSSLIFIADIDSTMRRDFLTILNKFVKKEKLIKVVNLFGELSKERFGEIFDFISMNFEIISYGLPVVIGNIPFGKLSELMQVVQNYRGDLRELCLFLKDFSDYRLSKVVSFLGRLQSASITELLWLFDSKYKIRLTSDNFLSLVAMTPQGREAELISLLIVLRKHQLNLSKEIISLLRRIVPDKRDVLISLLSSLPQDKESIRNTILMLSSINSTQELLNSVLMFISLDSQQLKFLANHKRIAREIYKDLVLIFSRFSHNEISDAVSFLENFGDGNESNKLISLSRRFKNILPVLNKCYQLSYNNLYLLFSYLFSIYTEKPIKYTNFSKKISGLFKKISDKPTLDKMAKLILQSDQKKVVALINSLNFFEETQLPILISILSGVRPIFELGAVASSLAEKRTCKNFNELAALLVKMQWDGSLSREMLVVQGFYFDSFLRFVEGLNPQQLEDAKFCFSSIDNNNLVLLSRLLHLLATNKRYDLLSLYRRMIELGRIDNAEKLLAKITPQTLNKLVSSDFLNLDDQLIAKFFKMVSGVSEFYWDYFASAASTVSRAELSELIDLLLLYCGVSFSERVFEYLRRNACPENFNKVFRLLVEVRDDNLQTILQKVAYNDLLQLALLPHLMIDGNINKLVPFFRCFNESEVYFLLASIAKLSDSQQFNDFCGLLTKIPASDLSIILLSIKDCDSPLQALQSIVDFSANIENDFDFHSSLGENIFDLNEGNFYYLLSSPNLNQISQINFSKDFNANDFFSSDNGQKFLSLLHRIKLMNKLVRFGDDSRTGNQSLNSYLISLALKYYIHKAHDHNMKHKITQILAFSGVNLVLSDTAGLRSIEVSESVNLLEYSRLLNKLSDFPGFESLNMITNLMGLKYFDFKSISWSINNTNFTIEQPNSSAVFMSDLNRILTFFNKFNNVAILASLSRLFEKVFHTSDFESILSLLKRTPSNVFDQMLSLLLLGDNVQRRSMLSFFAQISRQNLVVVILLLNSQISSGRCFLTMDFLQELSRIGEMKSLIEFISNSIKTENLTSLVDLFITEQLSYKNLLAFLAKVPNDSVSFAVNLFNQIGTEEIENIINSGADNFCCRLDTDNAVTVSDYDIDYLIENGRGYTTIQSIQSESNFDEDSHFDFESCNDWLQLVAFLTTQKDFSRFGNIIRYENEPLENFLFRLSQEYYIKGGEDAKLKKTKEVLQSLDVKNPFEGMAGSPGFFTNRSLVLNESNVFYLLKFAENSKRVTHIKIQSDFKNESAWRVLCNWAKEHQVRVIAEDSMGNKLPLSKAHQNDLQEIQAQELSSRTIAALV